MDTIEADGVFGAGGIRGLAIAGAVSELAKGNGRLRIAGWHSVAGTSAGAMIAAYLAAGRTPDQLMDMLARVPRPDYGRGGMILGGARNLIRRHGLALGERLQKWFDNEIDGLTFAQAPHLRVIAADITSRRILVLPDDLPRYRLPGAADPIDPDEFKVAYAVRMSMSIPYLVNPVQLEDGDGRLCTIVDGGVVSGFPVWLFDVSDRARKLERPTIGVRLAAAAAPERRPWWPIAMGLDLLHTGSEAWDQHVVAESARLRTCVIQTFAISGADFEASPAQREALIECGRQAAREFLADFTLAGYLNSAGRGFEPT